MGASPEGGRKEFRNLGERPVLSSTRIHTFSGLTLDADRGLLRDCERDIELRPKALSLLTYLVENAGRVISKSELLEAVWPNVMVTEDSLTQCIGEVRRAVGDQSGTLIKTVPRRGYIFSEAALGQKTDRPAAQDDREAIVPRRTGFITSAVASSLSGGDFSERPSIAVLPFTNLGSDREQEYFADGIVEDITTALGHFRRVFVIARNSAFTYKGRAVDVRDVGRDLGVRYVLEGSIRKAGQRLRITAQLIEAETGIQLWADRLEGMLDDVFGFQDEVTKSVIGAIAPRVMAAEVERARRKRSESLDAYDLYLRALPAIREMTIEGNDLALALVDRALRMDPNYAVMAGLGAWAYTLRGAQNWSVDTAGERQKGLDLARRAIAKGQDDSEALSMAGYTLGFLGEQLHEGLHAISRAISLNPNSSLAYANSGWLKSYLGETKEGILDFEEALRLSPREPTSFRIEAGLCFALILEGDLMRAIAAGRSAVEGNLNFAPAHRALAAALALSGRHEEARQVVGRLLRLVPNLTVTSFARQTLFRHSGKLALILEGLRRSGLPE